jgi:hypothetical protein
MAKQLSYAGDSCITSTGRSMLVKNLAYQTGEKNLSLQNFFLGHQQSQGNPFER